ncbi:hypothetical protein SBA4_3970009 [Candidatus Sulfopaludibacter sp. SbA4]|nr:hypothetical protein SBA4_3970009 [Candidatus Sulfopaludibacter sp. SbA4]
MPRAQSTVVIFPGRNYPKELDHLYIRLSAVNAMIEALEQYRRVLRRPTRHAGKRKTA